jgi:maltokinase
VSNEVPERQGDVQPPASWQYPFDFTAAVTIEPAESGSGWVCRPERIFAAATPAWGLSQADVAAARTRLTARDATGGGGATPGSGTGAEGVAEAFVELLRHEAVPPVPGFRIVRLVPPPGATGERVVEADAASEAAARSVVVGERVIVTWVAQIPDADHAGPQTLAHLDAVDFFGVLETHGILLWTTPTGREVPVAWATKYLPRASDGWDWCVDLTERALGLDGGGPRDPWAADFPSRLGRLAAKLHIALATPSRIVPEPTGRADPDLIRAWHAVASDTVRQAAAVAERGSLEGTASVLLPRLAAVTRTVDSLLTVADETCRPVVVQRVHGDLNVGQVLRWPGGLAVTDFHPDPALEFQDLRVGQAMQPAARDLARLLRSVDHVARVVDKRHGFTSTDAVDQWSHAARTQLLESYLAELSAAGRSDLLDERLVAPFEAEQLCREIVYADEHLAAWVYAPLGGLWQEYPVTDHARTGRHGKPARPLAVPPVAAPDTPPPLPVAPQPLPVPPPAAVVDVAAVDVAAAKVKPKARSSRH